MKNASPSLGYLITDSARLMRRRFDRLTHETGLTRAQFYLLGTVARSEGINQAALAELLDLEPISICRTIDRMQAGGFLERRPDPKDRRAFLIYMTEAARPALKRMAEVASEVYEELLADFSSEERETMIALLTRLHGVLSSDSPRRPLSQIATR